MATPSSSDIGNDGCAFLASDQAREDDILSRVRWALSHLPSSPWQDGNCRGAACVSGRTRDYIIVVYEHALLEEAEGRSMQFRAVQMPDAVRECVVIALNASSRASEALVREVWTAIMGTALMDAAFRELVHDVTRLARAIGDLVPELKTQMHTLTFRPW